jgi:hypothetical protein
VSEDVTGKFRRRYEAEPFLRVERLELTAHFLCHSQSRWKQRPVVAATFQNCSRASNWTCNIGQHRIVSAAAKMIP